MNGKEFYEGLTDDQKQALQECHTSEEAMAACRESGIAIPDELLESVSGGSGLTEEDLVCPKCNSTDVGITDGYWFVVACVCNNCKYEWTDFCM